MLLLFFLHSLEIILWGRQYLLLTTLYYKETLLKPQILISRHFLISCITVVNICYDMQSTHNPKHKNDLHYHLVITMSCQWHYFVHKTTIYVDMNCIIYNISRRNKTWIVWNTLQIAYWIILYFLDKKVRYDMLPYMVELYESQ